MDIVYVGLAVLFWIAVVGLARGCERLSHKGGH